MGKGKKYLILVLLLLGIPAVQGQQAGLTFNEFDQKSLELYENGDWKALALLCGQATEQGIDYYYLRIRAGIACYEKERFARAAIHFKKALEFNAGDNLAGEYLFYSYLQLNKRDEAFATYKSLPSSSQENLKNSLPKLRKINIQAGYITSNQLSEF